MPRKTRKPVGLARFGGVNRFSPPGRLARKREAKTPTPRPVCPYCLQFGRHATAMQCLSALSSPDQRALQHGAPGTRGW